MLTTSNLVTSAHEVIPRLVEEPSVLAERINRPLGLAYPVWSWLLELYNNITKRIVIICYFGMEGEHVG